MKSEQLESPPGGRGWESVTCKAMGILQRRSQFYLHVGICFFDLFLDCFCYYVVVQSLHRVQLFVTPGPCMPGSSILHHLLQSAQTHVHWVGDVIQPSHPLSPPSPSALNLSQQQGLFQWIGSSHQVAKLLQLQLQQQSFQWNSRLNSLSRDWFNLLTVQGSLKNLLQHNLKASVFQHSASFMSSSHICTRLLEKS